jgi:uncharacterized protein (TIGR00251 family)
LARPFSTSDCGSKRRSRGEKDERRESREDDCVAALLLSSPMSAASALRVGVCSGHCGASTPRGVDTASEAPTHMIETRKAAKEILLSVKVQPKASANRIVGEQGGVLKVCVTAAPEKGKANAAVIALLSKELGVPKSSIEIVAGQTSRVKTLRIRGLEEESLSERIKRAEKRGGRRGV